MGERREEPGEWGIIKISYHNVEAEDSGGRGAVDAQPQRLQGAPDMGIRGASGRPRRARCGRQGQGRFHAASTRAASQRRSPHALSGMYEDGDGDGRSHSRHLLLHWLGGWGLGWVSWLTLNIEFGPHGTLALLSTPRTSYVEILQA